MHCERCTYHLEGLPPDSDGRVKCPECGLSQYRRRFLPPWPSTLAVMALACGPTLALVALSLALRPLLMGSGFVVPNTRILGLLASVLGLLLPPIASLIPERSSLRRRQRSPMLLALAVTFGGWFVNFLAITIVVRFL